MLNETNRSFIVLLAEDDEEDRMLVRDVLQESGLSCELRTVRDGTELLDYLLRRGGYTNPEVAPRPSIVLLDLRMPQVDGWEALRVMKADSDLRKIPVIVLSSSSREEDIRLAYELGAAAYIRKEEEFEKLIEAFKIIEKYWNEVSVLPF